MGSDWAGQMFRRVGVAIAVRLGGGADRNLGPSGTGRGFGNPGLGLWDPLLAGYRGRGDLRPSSAAISPGPLLVPRATSPRLQGPLILLSSALGCPTAQSLHAPWGAPGPGAGGSGGPWAGAPGLRSFLRTRCPGARLSPGSSIQGGPKEWTPAAADPLQPHGNRASLPR